MTIKTLTYRDLVPDTDSYQEIFAQIDLNIEPKFRLDNIQPRLFYAFKQLSNSWISSPWLIIKAIEATEYLNFFKDSLSYLQPNKSALYGGEYRIKDSQITFHPTLDVMSNFTVKSSIITAEWVEAEQLFGCLRQFNGKLSIHPGLVHKANGGILMISLRTLLSQPLLWLRLKSIVTKQRFDWITLDESQPLPINIPSMPLSLKIVLIGNHESLANFQEIEPELIQKQAIYSEFKDNIYIKNTQDLIHWCQWVINVARYNRFSIPNADAWPILIREAVRYTNDQKTLPLCLLWLNQQLREVTQISRSEYYNGEQFIQMLIQREWREGSIAKSIQNEILFDQVLLETDGKRIGQVNALSVVEFPGHPQTFGEPSRISCVVYVGNGELNNIDHLIKLSDEIHTKGMMIMQAFLMAQLRLRQQIPFSASLTFEQSYSEVDGDSASMAGLCAFISALANIPIYQNIAITGSVDQFGRIQPVSDINKKIESFFYICKQRKLTGKQGVIIPVSNIHHLSLRKELIDAIKEKQFFIWAINDFKDALFLLTNLVWDGEEKTTLIKIIQNRITNVTQQDMQRNRYSLPWPLRWLNWF